MASTTSNRHSTRFTAMMLIYSGDLGGSDEGDDDGTDAACTAYDDDNNDAYKTR